MFQVDAFPAMEPYEYERGALSAAGIELVLGECTSATEVVERAQSAEVLWLLDRPPITGDVLRALPQCRLVVRWGVGYEHIDVVASTELGIAVANAPTWCTSEVAEHTMALLLAAARRIAWSHERLRRGEWPTLAPESVHRLRGRTLGLLGVGRIGTAVAGIGRGFGLRVIGYDSARRPEDLRRDGVEPVELPRLLESSDFLSVHVPLTGQTKGLVGPAMLARMKQDAILINTSRGRVVDQEALVRALKDGRLGGAALDVFEDEPLPADSSLRRLEQVVLTPHIGSLSAEALPELRAEMCRTTIDFIRHGWSTAVVNPEVRDSLRRAGRRW